MKIRLLGLICMLQVAGMLSAQDTERVAVKPVRFYVGVQPGFKPVLFNDYGQYAWDINLIPITVEYAINRRWALRVHSIWDLEVRPDNYPAALADVGIEIALPFHLALKNSEEGHRGFFIGPVLNPGYNRQNDYYQLGVAAEAGFAFLFGNKWSFNISAQAGFRLQQFSNGGFIRVVPYTIPVIGLGIWL
jgi:hypothetical protein